MTCTQLPQDVATPYHALCRLSPGHTMAISLGSEQQQRIHFRYWVIKFYECNLQRFVASSTVASHSHPRARPGLGCRPSLVAGLSEGVVIAKLLLTT